jgi:lipid-A-disaccharide synthase-like uncharacterized protein
MNGKMARFHDSRDGLRRAADTCPRCASGVWLHQVPREQKNCSALLIPHNLSLAMNTLHFLAETKLLGITLHPWKIVGLSGSLVFGLRFLIQWLASERAKKSVIPFGFWECSALGSLLMLSYFAIYKRDSVGVLSTAMPLPIYLRNLYFRYTHRTPKHAGNAPRPAE